MRDKPDVEIEEKRCAGKIRERGKFGERAACNHLFQLKKLLVLMGFVKNFDRAVETDPLLAAHQRFITEDGTGARFDYRLERIFNDEFRKGHDLVAGVAAYDTRFDGGSQGHANLHCDLFFFAGKMQQNDQRTLSSM
jgi:hypothetical protein